MAGGGAVQPANIYMSEPRAGRGAASDWSSLIIPASSLAGPYNSLILSAYNGHWQSLRKPQRIQCSKKWHMPVLRLAAPPHLCLWLADLNLISDIKAAGMIDEMARQLRQLRQLLWPALHALLLFVTRGNVKTFVYSWKIHSGRLQCHKFTFWQPVNSP